MSSTHVCPQLCTELQCPLQQSAVQVRPVNDESRVAVLLLEVGERGRVELLVVDVAADARLLESDGIALQSLQDAKVGKDAAEVGRDLDCAAGQLCLT